MQQSLFYLFLCSLLVSGCAGKVPQPVSQYPATDASLRPHQIWPAFPEDEKDIEKRISKRNKKIKNMVLGENVVPFRWK
ncbi:hypothetical protein [unidentified bacterial endosymbiont]|uniref:hypothetical protein n=1 Tax=unidentified bacterial endosymbiont TaxID=2355 RepID=UPI00209D0593|nr:hypothetical protein [unidentified bacterial endosymbiont]